ncbi:uncharacterized protein A1O9_07238 [Exophiala aquamarina CBS 119918]|uniref:Cutinase n=1 Tax=Exophiala aquamarina CBS 119918 TaxID=1182545 RepID=A0A072PCM2_9EURO|nr:uncharacterized protein A1O9_07238 [Exophiala aquamarina CBS 119918]KEF57048.1 hypothetical protein A1O9_07238 [Exophiala aquamarina CBS 119918]
MIHLLWFAVLSTTIVLRITPALAQEETPPPAAETPPPPVIDTPPPAVDPNSEQPPPPAEVTGEPVPEDGGQHDVTDEGEYYNVIPHLPEDCDDVRIFSARGSDEPYPGRGGAMLGVMCSLFESNGVSCDYEDVVYPANISYSGIFCQSANMGAFAGQSQMTEYVQRCPDSKIVLAGYSQGGGVVGDILGGGGGFLFGCNQPFNPPLYRNTTPGSSVAAAVTFGAPRFTANESYNIGHGSTYNGVLERRGQQLSDLNQYDDIIAMWCNAGDPVCAVGSEPVNITAHWSYYDEYTEVASRWVVATVLGHTEVRLDLDLDGQDESVVLTGSNSSDSSNDSKSSGGDEDSALGLRSSLCGGIGVSALVTLVTSGLVSIF